MEELLKAPIKLHGVDAVRQKCLQLGCYYLSLSFKLKLLLKFKSSVLWCCVVLWWDASILEDLAASIFIVKW